MRNILYLFIFTLHSILMSETISVPDDYSTIQDAIDYSTNGDSILVDPGYYPESINFEGKAIVVSSLYLIENDSLLVGATIIDAEQNGSVAAFDSEETNNTILQGFTLQNGIGNEEDPDDNGSYYTYGGGIYCENSDPIIKDCIISDNIANQGGGGGIFCYNSSPRFFGCTISSNQTDDVGGGLYSRSESSPEFYNCTFFNNTAEFGGGCYLRNESTPVMVNVTFRQNTATNSGGGIVLKDDSDLQADSLYLINNDAGGLGGGLYINNADPSIIFSLIAGNSSSSGGGVYIRNESTVNFTNITLSNNTSGLYGDGMYMRDGSQVSLLNSVVWGNGDSPIYFRSEGDDVELNIAYCLIQDEEDGVISNDNGDVNWSGDILNEEPYFCNSFAGNYYLRESSPCINAGADESLIGCFESACASRLVWYVDRNGSNTNEGSFSSPFETIERAITASGEGDTVRLVSGVYNGPINFSGTEIVLESMAYETGDLELITETFFAPGPIGGSCLTLDGDSNNNVTIRGLSFRGGSDSYGGGLVITNCSPTLEDIIVEDNSAEIGGGIYLSGSDAIFINATIRNNGANYGGGIFIVDGAPLLEDVLIEENIAYSGGGLYIENSESTIRYCKIKNNDSFIEGAGLYQYGGVCEIEWTAFENNNGYDYGGAIVADQATLDLNQMTFVNNISGVGSVMNFYSSAVTINNSILWDNSGPLFYSSEESGITSLEINYTDIEGGLDILSDYPNILLSVDGTNINEDPDFCNPVVKDFNLNESSPCQIVSSSGGIIGAYALSCQTTLANDNSPIIKDMMLSQNYPNPFNPLTEINYTLNENGNHSIKVFDIMGTLVKTIVTGYAEKGNYSIQWNSKNSYGEKVASGVYIYTFETPSRVITKKMILMK